MSRLDRLSALLSRFQMTVSVAAPGRGNFLVVGTADGVPHRVAFSASGWRPEVAGAEQVLLELRAAWGGHMNPLVQALPERIVLPVSSDADLGALVQVVLAEARASRCGVGSVLSRLGEVIFVRLIRAEMEKGRADSGLLAGLADARLSKALVAIHESPGQAWRNDELAALAGLSLSRFAALFQRSVGETPQAYLRRWRMTLAYQDIERGERIKTVSHRYGYASSEALARAFNRQFGKPPLAARRPGGPAHERRSPGRSKRVTATTPVH